MDSDTKTRSSVFVFTEEEVLDSTQQEIDGLQKYSTQDERTVSLRVDRQTSSGQISQTKKPKRSNTPTVLKEKEAKSQLVDGIETNIQISDFPSTHRISQRSSRQINE